MNIQPTLENDFVRLIPLVENDFEPLFAVASDPEIWEQHPNKDRYKREVFENFFQGAMESGGAFKIIDKNTGEIAGSTRFYDYDPEEHSIFIGYTFYATKFWGSTLNPQVKKLMLDYIFRFVVTVNFHVGKDNIRSRKAMEKLGATMIGELNVAYAYEPERLNVVYQINKKDDLNMKKYRIQASPFVVPTTDGKLIEEHWGNSTQTSNISIARMVAPPRWSEPHQTPEFDEFTIIISGRKHFEIDGEAVILDKGQSIMIAKGARVRYSNPFNEPCEYMAICLPAFSMDLVHREGIAK